MAETIEIDGKDYEVIGHDVNGVPTVRGIATTTQDGFDEDGNPKISVNISVPAITVGATPGEVK
jgi:hypothetical protein